jgi:hypothetical protein
VGNPGQRDDNANGVGDACDLLVQGIAVPVDVSGPINLRSGGVTPVVLLGSRRLDVAAIDPTTLAFGPGAAALAHQNGPHFDDVNDDGLLWIYWATSGPERRSSAPKIPRSASRGRPWAGSPSRAAMRSGPWDAQPVASAKLALVLLSISHLRRRAAR